MQLLYVGTEPKSVLHTPSPHFEPPCHIFTVSFKKIQSLDLCTMPDKKISKLNKNFHSYHILARAKVKFTSIKPSFVPIHYSKFEKNVPSNLCTMITTNQN